MSDNVGKLGHLPVYSKIRNCKYGSQCDCACPLSELFSCEYLNECIIRFVPLQDVYLHVRCTNKVCRDIAHIRLCETSQFILPLFNSPYSIDQSSTSEIGVFFTTKLNVGSIQFDDANLSTLAAAVDNGALPALKELYLFENKIGDAGMVALSEAIGKGALAALTVLSIGSNKIGDTGLAALSEAVSNGALLELQVLDLSWNQIGDAGLAAFSMAVGNGALPGCNYIAICNNPVGRQAQQSVENVLKSRR